MGPMSTAAPSGEFTYWLCAEAVGLRHWTSATGLDSAAETWCNTLDDGNGLKMSDVSAGTYSGFGADMGGTLRFGVKQLQVGSSSSTTETVSLWLPRNQWV